MKAATGELNLTVITIVAIALVTTFFAGALWPNIQKTITKQWNVVGGVGTDDKGNATGVSGATGNKIPD